MVNIPPRGVTISLLLGGLATAWWNLPAEFAKFFRHVLVPKCLNITSIIP